MNRDLEVLLLALDALLQVGSDDAARLEAIFNECVDDTLISYPNLTKDGLMRAVHAYHPLGASTATSANHATESLMCFDERL